MDKSIEKFIQQTAIDAGKKVAKRFGKIGVKYTKTDIADVVTEADLVANELIVDRIRKRYPGHDVISEELPMSARTSKYAWTIDPLDGTRNFVSGMPLFCSMISFVEKDEVKLGVVYDPIHKNLFFARKGHGAYLNGKRMHCSKTKEWDRSFGSGTVNMRKRVPKVFQVLARSAEKHPFWMSAFGSIGITMTSVASGKRDWSFSLGGGVWDYAPNYIILKEAGCRVTGLDGKPWKFGGNGMVIGNPYLQPKILRLVRMALG